MKKTEEETENGGRVFQDACQKVHEADAQIAFIQDVLIQKGAMDELTEDGQSGIFWILKHIREDLEAAVDKIDQLDDLRLKEKKKGKGVELNGSLSTG